MPIRKFEAKSIVHMTLPTHGPLHQLRKLFEVRDIGVFHSTMLPNCMLPKEVHGCDEIILRLAGETTIEVEEQLHRTGAMEATVIPAGTWHQSSSLEQERDVEQIVLLAYEQRAGSILDEMLATWRAEPRGHAL